MREIGRATAHEERRPRKVFTRYIPTLLRWGTSEFDGARF